jgi:hypothetical protein
MLVAGRRLIRVSETKNQAEAEYRYLLTRLRENGEGIALLQGDEEETSWGGQVFQASVPLVERCLCPDDAHHCRFANQRFHRANLTRHSLRAQIPGRLDDAWRGHAGGVSVCYGSICAQLVGRQFSHACRLGCLGAPGRIPEPVARCA